MALVDSPLLLRPFFSFPLAFSASIFSIINNHHHRCPSHATHDTKLKPLAYNRAHNHPINTIYDLWIFLEQHNILLFTRHEKMNTTTAANNFMSTHIDMYTQFTSYVEAPSTILIFHLLCPVQLHSPFNGARVASNYIVLSALYIEYGM